MSAPTETAGAATEPASEPAAATASAQVPSAPTEAVTTHESAASDPTASTHTASAQAPSAPAEAVTSHESAASDPTASTHTASGGGATGPEQVVQTSETAPPVEVPNAGLHESDPTGALDGSTSTPEPLEAPGAPDVGAPSDLSSSTEALLGSSGSSTESGSDGLATITQAVGESTASAEQQAASAEQQAASQLEVVDPSLVSGGQPVDASTEALVDTGGVAASQPLEGIEGLTEPVTQDALPGTDWPRRSTP